MTRGRGEMDEKERERAHATQNAKRRRPPVDRAPPSLLQIERGRGAKRRATAGGAGRG